MYNNNKHIKSKQLGKYYFTYKSEMNRISCTLHEEGIRANIGIRTSIEIAENCVVTMYYI